MPARAGRSAITGAGRIALKAKGRSFWLIGSPSDGIAAIAERLPEVGIHPGRSSATPIRIPPQSATINGHRCSTQFWSTAARPQKTRSTVGKRTTHIVAPVDRRDSGGPDAPPASPASPGRLVCRGRGSVSRNLHGDVVREHRAPAGPILAWRNGWSNSVTSMPPRKPRQRSTRQRHS